MDTLGDALPREMARVRDEVIPIYLEIGPPRRRCGRWRRNAAHDDAT